MSRFGGMMSGGVNAGRSGKGTIREFVKQNPNYMKMSSEERTQKLMEFKFNAMYKELALKSLNGKGNGFKLPGTSEPEKKEMSKTAQMMLEKMAMKQAKQMAEKMASKRKQVTTIEPKFFNGGRIDSRGTIYDAMGKAVGSINNKTLQIWFGNKSIGKYKDSSFCITKIERAVQELTRQKATGMIGMWGGGGNIWGGGGNSSGGMNTSGFWGNSDNKDSWW
jgi:Sec7-like guanine-nucleotide exchange factor